MIALDLLELVTAFVGYLLLYRLLDRWLRPRPMAPQVIFVATVPALPVCSPTPLDMAPAPMLLQGHAAP